LGTFKYLLQYIIYNRCSEAEALENLEGADPLLFNYGFWGWDKGKRLGSWSNESARFVLAAFLSSFQIKDVISNRKLYIYHCKRFINPQSIVKNN
jgi:hypothetical protein